MLINGSVGCRHVSGLLTRRAWPLALMRSGIGSLSTSRALSARFSGCSSPGHHRCHQLLSPPRSSRRCCGDARRCSGSRRRWSSIVLLPDHDRPGDPRHLVGQRQRTNRNGRRSNSAPTHADARLFCLAIGALPRSRHGEQASRNSGRLVSTRARASVCPRSSAASERDLSMPPVRGLT